MCPSYRVSVGWCQCIIIIRRWGCSEKNIVLCFPLFFLLRLALSSPEGVDQGHYVHRIQWYFTRYIPSRMAGFDIVLASFIIFVRVHWRLEYSHFEFTMHPFFFPFFFFHQRTCHLYHLYSSVDFKTERGLNGGSERETLSSADAYKWRMKACTLGKALSNTIYICRFTFSDDGASTRLFLKTCIICRNGH